MLQLLLLLLLLTSSEAIPQRRERSDEADLAALAVASPARSLLVDLASAPTASAGHKRHVTRPRPRPASVVRLPSSGIPEKLGFPIVKVIRRRKFVQPGRHPRPSVSEDAESGKNIDIVTDRSSGTFLRPRVLALLDDSQLSGLTSSAIESSENGNLPFKDFGKKLEPGSEGDRQVSDSANLETIIKGSDIVTGKSEGLLKDSLDSARMPVVNGSVLISDIQKQSARRDNSEITQAKAGNGDGKISLKDTRGSEVSDRHKILVRRKTLRIIAPERTQSKTGATNETQVGKVDSIDLVRATKSTTTTSSALNTSERDPVGEDSSKILDIVEKRTVTRKPVSALFPTTSTTESPLTEPTKNTFLGPELSTQRDVREHKNESKAISSSVLSLFPTTTSTTTQPPSDLSENNSTKSTTESTTEAVTTTLVPSAAPPTRKKLPLRIVRPSVSLPPTPQKPLDDGRRTNASEAESKSEPRETVASISKSPEYELVSQSSDSRGKAPVLTSTRQRPSLSRAARLRNRLSQHRIRNNSTSAETPESSDPSKEKTEVSKVLGLLGKIRNRARRPPTYLSSRNGRNQTNNTTEESGVIILPVNETETKPKAAASTSTVQKQKTTLTRKEEATQVSLTTTSAKPAVMKSTTSRSRTISTPIAEVIPATAITVSPRTTTSITKVTTRPSVIGVVDKTSHTHEITPELKQNFTGAANQSYKLVAKSPSDTEETVQNKDQRYAVLRPNPTTTSSREASASSYSQVAANTQPLEPTPPKINQTIKPIDGSGKQAIQPSVSLSSSVVPNQRNQTSAPFSQQRPRQRPDALRRTPPSSRGGDLSRRLQLRRNLYSYRAQRPPLPLLLSTVREALPALVSKNPNGSNFTLNVTFPPSTPRALLQAEKLIPPSQGDEVESKVLGTSLSTSVSIAVSPLEFRLRKRVKLSTTTERPVAKDSSSKNGERHNLSNDPGFSKEEQQPFSIDTPLENTENTFPNEKTELDASTFENLANSSGIKSDTSTIKLERPAAESVIPARRVVIELIPKLPAPFIAISSKDRRRPVSPSVTFPVVVAALDDEKQLPTSPATRVPQRGDSSLVDKNETDSDEETASTQLNSDASGNESNQSVMDHTYLQSLLVNSRSTPSTVAPRSSTYAPAAKLNPLTLTVHETSTQKSHLLSEAITTEASVTLPTDTTLQRILSPSDLSDAPKDHSSGKFTSHVPSGSSGSEEVPSTSARAATVEEVPLIPESGIEELAVLTASEEQGSPSKSGDVEALDDGGGDGPIYLVSLLFVLPVVAVALWYLKKNYPEIQQLMPERLKSIMAHEPSDSGHDNFCADETDVVDKKASTSSQMHDTLARRRRWEHPRETLRLQSVLGEGHFGQVWRAEVDSIGGHSGTLLVAVKNVKENAGSKEKQDLQRELRIMQDLGSHPNVVTLLGCCTEEEPILVIMEYMVFGKLLTYLRENRGRHNYFNFSHDSAVVTSPDLTLFGCQVASGMEYIAAKGIVHRDLAARNVLVDHTKICKVSDFGMSRSQKEISCEVFEQRHRGALPIRWMSPESLYHNTFNQKTDSWSFGILLWEIITLGSTPYPGLSAREVMRSVREGYRLERPDHCHPQLYQLASSCWTAEPEWRPSFTQLRRELEVLLEDQNQGYVDLDRFQEEIYSTLNKSSDEKV